MSPVVDDGSWQAAMGLARVEGDEAGRALQKGMGDLLVLFGFAGAGRIDQASADFNMLGCLNDHAQLRGGQTS